ncbi:MAG: DMT family transporter [Magnetococcales bacterium]|nr:DMT family transporter [Magnetococcales bacterium]
MAILFAFIGVVIIWGTTPLALQWSIVNVNILFAVMSRMVLGLIVCLITYGVSQNRIPFHKKAIFTYFSGGLGIFGAMVSTYWSAQFIPSGWISVIFGLSTIVTGVLAYFWLNEPFGLERWIGLFFGILGLAIIFIHSSSSGSHQATLGILGILSAVIIYTISTVAVKRFGSDLPAMATTTGSLMVAVPCFILAWMLDGGQWPEVMTIKVAGSIIYLGIIGSVVGFALYYFILKNIDASKAMLTTLLAPVVALYLGTTLNGEIINARVLLGTGMILTGLAAYQWGKPLINRLQGAK